MFKFKGIILIILAFSFNLISDNINFDMEEMYWFSGKWTKQVFENRY
ncbi:MAG: hypothetical protein WHV67_04690 [Thermoanaerobaculia bacterium]